jgi:hypothetical protein
MSGCWVGHVARKVELENVCRVLLQKKTRERPSGRRETILKLILENLVPISRKSGLGYVIWILWQKIGTGDGLL